MQRKAQSEQNKKLNNKGFSLVEVLVAIIILSIVSIPIIRSFATVAKTNADARVMLRATDGAENIMENLEYRTLEDIVARYDISDQNTITVDSEGRYQIVIKDVADLPTKLPTGYYMTITADPTLYRNANALNIADVKSMMVSDTAVYEMSKWYDDSVYETFDRWNMESHEDNPIYQRTDSDYFKEKLTRTIEVTINKTGTAEVTPGEFVDLVTVKLDIKYHFKDMSLYYNYLPSARKEYVESTKEIFNNSSTKTPLSNIFILYYPRYLANNSGNKDNIIIKNVDNVPANVFIAAQKGAEDTTYKDSYFNASTGPLVTIMETTSGSIASSKAAITLRTNLSDSVPYSSLPNAEGVIKNGKILCNLTYQNETGTASVSGEDALKVLDARDLDGRALIAENTKNRIYKVKVTVWDEHGNSYLELDGTKLE